MANPMPRCELCVFSVKIGTYLGKKLEEERMECRFNFPRLSREDGWRGCAIWPRVLDTDWCGKFRDTLPPKPEEMTYDFLPGENESFTVIPVIKKK